MQVAIVPRRSFGMGKLFSGLIGGAIIFLSIVWFSMLATLGGLVWYMSENYETVAGVGVAVGIIGTVLIFLFFQVINLIVSAIQDARTASMFRADQEADALQASSMTKLLREQMQAQLAFKRGELVDLKIEGEYDRLEPADEEEAVTLEGDLFERLSKD